MDHISYTPGFTLAHLKYLVMDEADRLMNQHYQGWLETVYSHIQAHTPVQVPISMQTNPQPYLKRRVQKLLFSATLTRNPAKLSFLQLHDPLYIAVGSLDSSSQKDQTAPGTFRFTIPPSLKEEYISCSSQDKLLVLLHLLLDRELSSLLIFCKSVVGANRLSKVLELAGKGQIKASCLSSTQSPAERKKILGEFTSGSLNALVCSDLVARGIDIENAQVIVNYDIPPNTVTYIHRVGRTARAGREGTSISLVESGGQTSWFLKNIVNGDIGRLRVVERKVIDKVDTDEYVGVLTRALAHIKESEKRGKRKDSESSSNSSSSSDSDSSSDSSSSSDSDTESILSKHDVKESDDMQVDVEWLEKKESAPKTGDSWFGPGWVLPVSIPDEQ
jgi:ATP-dependent RNA helicase DDX51/DBP6